ncbi:hypothetical protein QQS21_008581 [Conoideocrella luteorostrata]|uniref:Phospholipase/carboxylesterase/thioesterase domain-containing protein n=1 Tax=Conoideocrella luteorostrata TaxID=1105319 RepID=A0AAJ0CIM5_9HYPO|nr:hypothetical protein QQS21_008581 [Conoideocrella luteorostrata]
MSRRMPHIRQARGTHTHTVIFLHGRGDSAESLSASFEYSKDCRNRTLFDAFPSFRWVFPKSGETVSFSAGGNKVSQWFDIWNVNDFSDREEIQTLGLKESVGLIRKILTIEADILKGRWDRIILAGISQGAATAAHTLLNLSTPKEAKDGTALPGRLGAFVGFSCRMPFPGRSLEETRNILALDDVPEHDDVIRKTPVLLEHCADDLVVPVMNGRRLRDTLHGFGAQVEWREYPDGGHWFHSPDGMDDVIEFLTHVLGLDETPSTAQMAENPGGSEMDLS